MKVKYKLLSLLIGVFLLSFLAGCSDETNSAEDSYNLKLTHVAAEDHATNIAATGLAEKVEEKSDGRLTITVYPAGQLYPSEEKGLEATITDDVDISISASPVFAGFDKRFMAVDVPFLFDDLEESQEAIDGEFGDELDKVIEDLGLVSLGWGDTGFKQMYTTEKPIASPEDIEGLKVRVMENKMYQDMFNMLGGNATSHAFGELYSALQQGTFDMIDGPPSLVYTNKFNEVLEHMTITNHVYAPAVTVINEDSYNKLPEDLQDILKEAAEEEVQDKYREVFKEQDEESLEDMKEEGLKVKELSNKERNKFKEKVQKPIYDKYKDDIGEDLTEIVEKYINK